MHICLHAYLRTMRICLHAYLNMQALEKLLRNRLAFGTAGLRGAMGAGYSRMNPVTIWQCTQVLE